MDNESTGGAISFEMMVETGMLDRALKQSIDEIKHTGDEASRQGKRIDEAFAGSARAVAEQKVAVERLKNAYKELRDRADSLAPGKAQYEVIKQVKAVKRELDQEIETFNKMQQAVKQNEKAHESFRTQLWRVREELTAMETAGKRGSAEYKVLQDEAGRLTDAMKDAQAQASVLAHDQRGLQGVIAAVSGIAGGFSAAQGAIGLFVGENENLQKIMLKVQSLMAITIGLQQIQQTLDKDSAFMLVTVAKAKELYASATNRLTVALGLSNVAAKALMATLTLGLSAAFGAAIYLIDRYISKQREAAKKQEEFSKAISEEAYKAVSSIETLSAKYKSLGDNLKAKEKFIKDNANAFDELGVSVRNVEEAENILINNKDAFVDAQIQKAKAIAAGTLAAEKWKEWLLVNEKLSGTNRYKDEVKLSSQIENGQVRYTKAETIKVLNPDYTELEEQKSKIKKEIDSLVKISVEADSAAEKIIENLGVNGDKTLGIIEKLKKELADLEGKKEKSKTGSEILALNKEIEAKKNELSKYEVKESKTSKKDPFSEQLEKRKKLYQDYFNWINSNRPDLAESAKKEFENLLKGGNSFMESLEKQAKELEGKKGITDEQKKQLKTIRDYIATEVKTTTLDTFEKELTAKLEAAKTTLEKMSILDQAKPTGTTDLDKAKQIFIDSEKEKTIREEKELTKELLANYAGYLQEKIQFNETYAEKKRLLNLAAEKAENEDAKKIAKEALDELERQKDQYNKKSGNKDYDDLVTKYKNFKQQLNDLIVDFDKKVKVALENGNKELADTILKAKEDEVKKLVTSFSSKEVSQYLESLNKSLAVNLAIFSVTGEQTEELLKIKSIIELINKALKEGKRENIVKALDFAVGSLNEISGLMGELDEKSQAIVNRLIGITDGLAQIYSGNVFQGATQIIFSIVDGLDKQFGLQKKIADVEEARAEYNRKLSVTLETITSELDKQLKLLDDLSVGEAYNPSIEALKGSIRSASKELENLRLDFAKSPPNVRIQFDIDHLKDIFNTDDTAKALNQAFSEGLITEEQYNLAVQYLSTIEDAEEQLKQLHEEYKEALLGTTSESITDAIIEGLIAGKRGIADFAGTFEDMMRKSIINAMLVKALQPAIDNFVNTWFAVATDADGLTPFDITTLQSMYEGILNWGGQLTDDMLATFPDLFDALSGTNNSLSGAIKGVTEETAGLIAGQMNAIRINQAHALALMDEQLANLSEIASNTRYNRKLDLLPQILNELRKGSSNPSTTTRANGGQ